MDPEARHEIAIRWCAERRAAEIYALVLSAKGISSAIARSDHGFSLLVAAEDADQSRTELTAYDAENEERPTASKGARSPASIELLLACWAAFLFFFAAARSHALGIDWLEIGSAQVDLIRQGEWWRIITALFLHESGLHLVSNLAFGTVFLLLLSQVLGPGMTALALVACGAGGNLLDALVRPSSHAFIGASTAIFAAVGLLAALRYKRRGGRRMFSTLRDWAPIGGGIMLLAFLGFGDAQTDVLAHIFGFASGIGLGIVLARRDQAWIENSRAQVWSAWSAGGIGALAWLCAIFLRP